MIENISVISRSRFGYILKVYTKGPISSQLGKAFILEWSKMIFFRKRRIEIVNKEIRIYLKYGDTIQKYIDHACKVFCQAEITAKLLQEKRSSKRRNIKLRNNFDHKSYRLKQNSSFSSYYGA